MQNTQEKRRCSILKKRRSRSLSPKSPTRELQTARRASRRISFSGKHNVREFFTNENAAVVWGETYDVSTEKHVLSNEQITLQSTRSSSMSTTLQVTRNESTVMDISNAPIAPIAPNVAVNEKPFAPARVSNLRPNQPYSEDQKENVLLVDDADMELSLIMQPPTKSAPRQSLFSVPSKRPSLFSFTHKSEASMLVPAEKTSGSDNMDISGIEPTVPSSEPLIHTSTAGNNYRDWLKQNNFIAKPETHQTQYVQQDVANHKKSSQSSNRMTINEPHEMSCDSISKTAAQTIENKINFADLSMDLQLTETYKPNYNPPYAQQDVANRKKTSQSSNRMTINEAREMTFDSPLGTVAQTLQNNTNFADLSMDLLPSETYKLMHNPTHDQQDIANHKKPSQSTNRMTINEPSEMSFDSTSKTAAQTFGNKTNFADISMDLQLTEAYKPKYNPPYVQQGVANHKKSSQSLNRMTINEPREMSFDSTTKSATKTFSNKTILADMSMDLQTFEQPTRKSVIHKSPSKNATKQLDQSESFEIELTRGIDQNSMYLSYHPLHSTKLNEINSSKFTEMDFDTSVQIDKAEDNTLHSASMIEETVVDEHKGIPSADLPSKRVQMFNQSKRQSIRGVYDLDMSEDSPISTAKKYNLNKTPFYFGIDKENDPALIETMHASGSSLDITNTSVKMTESFTVEEQIPAANLKSGTQELRRGTVLLHATIGNETNLTAAAEERDTTPIEISDTSIELPHNDASKLFSNIGSNRRKTCVDEISMALEPIKKEDKNKASNIMTQSILQITPIKIDDSIDDKLVNPFSQGDKENRRLTTVANETISLDDSPIGNARVSFGLEESKQLTFIEDDDEDDQICNTKLDLAGSLESSDINDLVYRKNASVDQRSINISKFSLASMNSEHMLSLKETAPKAAEPNPVLAEALKLAELEAFRKSNRLRHSNVFDVNASTDTNPNETAPKDEVLLPVHKKDTATDDRISMGPVGRSSILMRRSNNNSNLDANDTSFLPKSVANKPLSELKLDFSGYDKFVGLATPQDVFNDFCSRMNQIKLKADAWQEERRKLENGEIDSIDTLNNNDEALVSQNVEAPSWSSLYMNKIKWEEEQLKAELERQWEEREIGAFLPAIPDIDILIQNKCRVLKNWTFDDIWFFQGNIHLRNIQMPAFKVCLIYDPNMVGKCVNTYGTLKFSKINHQFCPIHLKRRTYAVFKLEMLELSSKLPKNLLPLCETSSQLSNFDDRLNEYCINAQNKVKKLHELCRKMKAVIKEENGTIYILKCMLDFKRQEYQEYIIELSDIDSTDWRCVRTNPQRVLNETIKSLPKGMAFIKELLTADSKYVPWQ